MMVITARATRFIEGDRARLEKFAGEATKPVLLWSYTLPTERNAEIVPRASEWYDYAAKYIDEDGATFTLPAQIPSETADELRAVAQISY